MTSDIIHLLPDSVANQIAAGEVIQRPASVVKELVENAIDAGAKKVQIIIKDAGRTLIQIIDDGCGMSVTDARMAFERHATSKIRAAQDLSALCTMGFRGEALPSVAAVSEIELRTRRKDDVTGTRLKISASKVESQEPDVCAQGTNMMVKRLFFNLPARRKFLKKDAVELGHIAREFERLALVNTDIEFEFSHNDHLVQQLSPAPLKRRICDLFGKSLDHQLIPIATDTSLVKIDGFVSLPANARRRGALQYFFVNGRNMRHSYFHKAVMSCYENLISAEVQPSYFINFVVAPDTIDVNIHPQKYEVKFENEQPIWQILTACIKEALGRFNASSAIDFDSVDVPFIPALDPDRKGNTELDVDLHYDPFAEEKKFSRTVSPSSFAPPVSRSSSVPTDWEKLYADFTSRESSTVESALNQPDEPIAAPAPDLVPSLMNAKEERPGAFQLKGRYIVTSSKSGLMLIDQHRAHVNVLFEKYMEAAEKGAMPSQRLIFPESITFDASQHIVVLSINDMLCTMGFDIACLGGHDWSINAVPAMLGTASPTEALANIVNSVMESPDDVQQSQWRTVALSMARSAAIKRGAVLSDAEIDALIADLFKLSSPDYTPDGYPTIRLLDFDDINKMFS